MTGLIRGALGAALLLCGLGTLATPVLAQEKTAIREGFTMPASGSTRILLLRPSIKVGAQSTGGMYEPNADWTDSAKTNIAAAIAAAQGGLGNRIVTVDEPVGAAAQRLADYQALFSTVAGSVITYKFFVGNRLPTKKRAGVFDWTLGTGIKDMPGADQADYALFLTTEDHYGSTGRKLLQFVAAAGGVGVSAGVHKGYAGLVDLKTGDLVWLNADMQMGGDVRTAEGAQKRVAQLLEGLPGRPAAAIAAAAPAAAQ